MRSRFQRGSSGRCVVKIKGPRDLLLEVQRVLEDAFIAFPTGRPKPNDEDDGYHIFLMVLEATA